MGNFNLQGFVQRYNVKAICSIIEIVCVLLFIATLISPNFIYRTFCLYSVSSLSVDAEYWRLITPIFIHFGILHIAFNLVMFEAFARPIENILGKGKLLNLIILSALLSNGLQFLMMLITNHQGLFGGMSGVVYSLIGYIGILSKRNDLPYELRLPSGLLTVSVIFIAFGFLIDGIANFAHIGGLFVGLILGFYDLKKLKFY